MLPDLLISIGTLIHDDGPLYDKLFKPLFDFLRVALTFEKMTVYYVTGFSRKINFIKVFWAFTVKKFINTRQNAL